MNICIISNLYPPEIIGGAEKHVRDDCIALEKKGHSVSVITTQESGHQFKFNHQINQDINVFRFSPLNMYSPVTHPSEPIWKKPLQHTIDLWNPHSYLMIKKKLKEIDPDIIHIHVFAGLSFSIFSAASHLNIPVFHTIHDYALIHHRPGMFVSGTIDEPRRIHKIYHKYVNRTVEQYVDVFLAPSQFIIDKHREYGVLLESTVQKLPLGHSNEITTEHKQETESGITRFLFVGQLTEQKGIKMLVTAFSEIEGIDDLRLDVVGKGPLQNDIETIAKESENIHIHGFVSETQLNLFYQKANYTVLPSTWYDNSPMVIYESYSFGTPVIGADIGGIPELIEPGKTGYIFPSMSPSELKKQLVTAVETYHPEMSKLAKEKSEELTIENHVRSLEKEYENAQ